MTKVPPAATLPCGVDGARCRAQAPGDRIGENAPWPVISTFERSGLHTP